MNQASIVPFGVDASRLAGYAMTANERLGAIDFVFENVGSIAAYIKVMAYVSPSTTPSGYSDVLPLQNEAYGNVTNSPPSSALTGFTSVGPPFVLAPKGVLTRSYNLLAKRIGFFGSGIAATVTQMIAPYQSLKVSSTVVNITAVIRNPSDLRGAQIDIGPVTVRVGVMIRRWIRRRSPRSGVLLIRSRVSSTSARRTTTSRCRSTSRAVALLAWLARLLKPSLSCLCQRPGVCLVPSAFFVASTWCSCSLSYAANWLHSRSGRSGGQI